tara:strand:- start:51 stop:941 length:891 start_codon:yes stop_codon:yes gene_type:complete
MFNDYNSDKLVFRIRINKSNIVNKKKRNKNNIESLDQSNDIHLLKTFMDDLLDSLILRGIKNINKVSLRKITDNFEEIDLKYTKKEIWVLDTVGSNLLDILALDFIDYTKTTTNNIIEIYNILGIEAARQAIFDEFSEVIEFDSTYINYHHLTVLCDRMTCNDKMVSVFRHGINNDNIGPIAKASFEETPEMFLKAAKHGELDLMTGVSANVMCGQEGYYGTNNFKIIPNIEEIMKINKDDLSDRMEKNNKTDLNEFFNDIEDVNECSTNNLLIDSIINSIKQVDIGNSDGYDLPF